MATSRACVSLLGSTFMLAALLSTETSGAATLTVCPSGCDHFTIQAAATAADPGDTIQILSSLPHTEGDIFLTKDLTINGLGILDTIIQADANSPLVATVPVFVVTNGATITMTALRIRHGNGPRGGGIRILDGHVTLEDVRVDHNNSSGIYVAATCSLETNRTIIDGNESLSDGGGVFAEGPVEMTNTDVTDNHAAGSHGGGIWSASVLTLRWCRLVSNHASVPHLKDNRGGGLHYSGPSLLIEDTLFSSNRANDGGIIDDQTGGGLYLTGTGTATMRRTAIRSNIAWHGAGLYSDIETFILEDCTISDNDATFYGGGMIVEGTGTSVVRILNSTIVGNEGPYGGGLFSNTTGRVVISNSTMSGNAASRDGGGIYAQLSGVEIASSTLTDNTADSNADGNGNGGGIYIFSGESVELRNSIIASNHDLSPLPAPRASDCAGTVQSAGYNLIRSLGLVFTSCNIVGITAGNLVGADPLLGMLAGNGGTTETHALGPGSPAINAGNPAGCRDPDGALLDADQRHGLRQDRCDMGAFEVGALIESIHFDGFESGSTSGWSSTVR